MKKKHSGATLSAFFIEYKLTSPLNTYSAAPARGLPSKEGDMPQ